MPKVCKENYETMKDICWYEAIEGLHNKVLVAKLSRKLHKVFFAKLNNFMTKFVCRKPQKVCIIIVREVLIENAKTKQ